MDEKKFHIYLILSLLAICRVNLAPTNCKMPNSDEKGQCVKLSECSTFQLDSDFANPDLFNEINERTESCRLIDSKLLCCEVTAVSVRIEETTTTTSITTYTSTIVAPTNLDKPFSAHPNYKLFDNDNCGVATSNRIANGEDAGLLQFPWAARLGYETLDGIKWQCGGTLISDFYTLTAAHCLLYLPKNNKLKIVRLGEYDERTEKDCSEENNCADPIQDIDVMEFIAYPGYDRIKFSNDIGIIRMKNAAKVTQNNIKPICMPFDANAKRIGKKFTVIGWGRTQNGTTSPILQKAFVPEYDSKKCEEKFAEKKKIEIIKGQICAGGEEKIDSCKGDSGSSLQQPVLINKKPRMVQFGIVSIGVKECGSLEGYPGIYTRVTEYLNWIMDNMH